MAERTDGKRKGSNTQPSKDVRHKVGSPGSFQGWTEFAVLVVGGLWHATPH